MLLFGNKKSTKLIGYIKKAHSKKNGLGFDDIADLLGVQSRSVDRVVYRICRKMGLGQGSKEEFVAQINRMSECATNK